MPKYRIVSDSMPFSFDCGNSSNSDLQAKYHLSVFAFKPSSYTLQKLTKREWHDVCRRDLATGYLEYPDGTVRTPDGKLVSGSLPPDVPCAPAPNAPALAPGEPILGTGPPAKEPVVPFQSTISPGGTVKTESWRLEDGGTGEVMAEGSVAPHLAEMHRIANVARSNLKEQPPWESSNIAIDKPIGEQEIDNGSPEPAPAARRGRSRKPAVQEVVDEPF